MALGEEWTPGLEQSLHRSVSQRSSGIALGLEAASTTANRNDRLIQSDLPFLVLSYRCGQRIYSSTLTVLHLHGNSEDADPTQLVHGAARSQLDGDATRT